VAATADYGSGLPVELDPASIDMNLLLAQYGPEILSRINFDRGRVRPNFSLGAAFGVELYRKEKSQPQSANRSSQSHRSRKCPEFRRTFFPAPP